MDLILATKNLNKVNEFKSILGKFDINLISLFDLNDNDEVEETGNTFLENSKIKASYYANKYQMPVISDDSGLEVFALKMKPGIYSSRYSGFGSEENNKKILFEMENVENRNARFVCAISVCFPDKKTFQFEDYVYGKIAYEQKGANGFGYDSIFYYESAKMTFGEMDLVEKNKISHRSNALKKMVEKFDEIINYWRYSR